MQNQTTTKNSAGDKKYLGDASLDDESEDTSIVYFSIKYLNVFEIYYLVMINNSEDNEIDINHDQRVQQPLSAHDGDAGIFIFLFSYQNCMI